LKEELDVAAAASSDGASSSRESILISMQVHRVDNSNNSLQLFN